MKSRRPFRVELIDRSMTCFILGLLSILPFIGLPLAVAALTRYWQVKRLVRKTGDFEWNPAERYAHWGSVLAAWGGSISLLASITIGMLLAIAQSAS